ncbi:iron uptake protein [Variovorax sp. LT2P21]|uniref:iron uptake protein n=1 Tax=Variovorax sp. LT2P21 TaxID=3443731 RepID=UPI003F47915B
MARPAVWLRVAAAVGGGFGLTSLAVVVLAGLLARWGLPGAEAVVAAAMAGFLIYLAVLLWGLACQSTWRLGGWLALWVAALACAWRWAF